MLLVLAAVSAYAAWACMALAMPSHWKSLMHRPLPPTGRLKILAAGLAMLSLASCVFEEGRAFGMLMWICLACVTAWLWVATLALLGRPSGKPAGAVTASGHDP